MTEAAIDMRVGVLLPDSKTYWKQGLTALLSRNLSQQAALTFLTALPPTGTLTPPSISRGMAEIRLYHLTKLY